VLVLGIALLHLRVGLFARKFLEAGVHSRASLDRRLEQLEDDDRYLFEMLGDQLRHIDNLSDGTAFVLC